MIEIKPDAVGRCLEGGGREVVGIAGALFATQADLGVSHEDALHGHSDVVIETRVAGPGRTVLIP